MTQMIRASLLLSALLLLPAVSMAEGGGMYGWLRASPVQVFTQEDWEMLRKTARETLDDAPDGTNATWRNDDTGHSGSTMVISTYEEDGRRCRKATFTNEARGMKGVQTHRLCKANDGTWKVTP